MAIPVTIDDVKKQLRVTDADGPLQTWIDDAVAWVEDYTGLILTARDVTATLRSFVDRLPGWPIKNDAAVALSYGATPTTIAGAGVDLRSRPARLLRPASLAAWPVLGSADAISVTYRAGYETADTVPAVIRRAMLILIAAYDADREGGEIFTAAEASARRVVRSLRVRRL